MYYDLGEVLEGAVANWPKRNFALIRYIAFDINLCHFITPDLPMNPQSRLNFCSFCGS